MKKSVLVSGILKIAVALAYTVCAAIYFSRSGNIWLLLSGVFAVMSTASGLINKLPGSGYWWILLPPHTFACVFWCVWFGVHRVPFYGELPSTFMTIGLIIGIVFTVFIFFCDMRELKRLMKDDGADAPPPPEDTQEE